MVRRRPAGGRESGQILDLWRVEFSEGEGRRVRFERRIWEEWTARILSRLRHADRGEGSVAWWFLRSDWLLACRGLRGPFFGSLLSISRSQNNNSAPED